jgi:hypothetical protein
MKPLIDLASLNAFAASACVMQRTTQASAKRVRRAIHDAPSRKSPASAFVSFRLCHARTMASVLTPADSARLLDRGYEGTLRVLRRPPRIKTPSFRPRSPKFTDTALGSFGFRHELVARRTATASSWIRVPQAVRLPPTSFRFLLAANTFALG